MHRNFRVISFCERPGLKARASADDLSEQSLWSEEAQPTSACCFRSCASAGDSLFVGLPYQPKRNIVNEQKPELLTNSATSEIDHN